ncbi:hypothetical protein DPMN_006465 [Dreissena polymorpha]|uniref:Uncharacterized protein n=1 Tax=Dreissena polymorpha TaxID=45954 RepID=A0A9D4RVE3_DREPO|nr:hypothetical protein DPMN_006465 [Dreissena polymorpha]
MGPILYAASVAPEQPAQSRKRAHFSKGIRLFTYTHTFHPRNANCHIPYFSTKGLRPRFLVGLVSTRKLVPIRLQSFEFADQCQDCLGTHRQSPTLPSGKSGTDHVTLLNTREACDSKRFL